MGPRGRGPNKISTMFTNGKWLLSRVESPQAVVHMAASGLVEWGTCRRRAPRIPHPPSPLVVTDFVEITHNTRLLRCIGERPSDTNPPHKNTQMSTNANAGRGPNSSRHPPLQRDEAPFYQHIIVKGNVQGTVPTARPGRRPAIFSSYEYGISVDS